MNERLNVRRMQMPEAVPEARFDIKKQITAKDWEGITKEIQKNPKTGGLPLVNIANMAINSAGIRDPASIGFGDDHSETFYDEWYDETGAPDDTQDWRNAIRIWAALKSIRPGAPMKMTEADKKKCVDLLERDRSREHWINFANEIEWIKIVNPFEALPVTDDDWTHLKGELSRLREENDAGLFAVVAGSMRMVFPEKTLELRDSDWDMMRASLEKDRKENNYFGILFWAKYLSVLAAHEIKWTKEGIEIVPAKPSHQERIAPIPTTPEL